MSYDPAALRQHIDEVVEAGRKWDPPRPLPSQLLKVAAFDPNVLLPAALRDYAVDVADRMQCPIDYVGASLMVAAGAVVGRKVAIRPQLKTDWTEVPNLWGAIVGRAGVMKSPAMKQALSPIRRLDALAAEKNKDAKAGHDLAMKRHKLEASAREAAAKLKAKNGDKLDDDDLKDEPPEPPGEKRLLVNDATYEALGEVLAQNKNGVLYYRDELVSMLKPLDREENAAARGFLLAAWNGNDSYTFDRIGRGRVHLEACCVSVLGATQPAKLAAYLNDAVKGGSGDDGFAQRFGLLVWPDVSGDWHDIDRFPDGEGRRSANITFDRLDGLTPQGVSADKDEFDPLPYLRFAPSAAEAFGVWRRQLEAKIRSGDLHPAMESHLAKYRGLVPKLALLSHLLEHRAGPVTLEALGQALAWAEYLESHAQRAYASVVTAQVQGARTILQKLKTGDLETPFTLRRVHQAGWSGLSDKEDVNAALTLLVDYDWLVETDTKTGGRPTVLYVANPLGLAA